MTLAAVQVVVCKAGETSAMCSDGSAAAAETKGAVYIRPGLTDAQLKVALQVLLPHFCTCGKHPASGRVWSTQYSSRSSRLILWLLVEERICMKHWLSSRRF